MVETVTDNNLLNDFNKDYNYCSWFNNISSCLKKDKIEQIFNHSLNKQDSIKCITLFREGLRDISNYKISIDNHLNTLILKYAYIWCGTPEIAKDFMSSITDKAFYRYFSVKYIGNKRIRGQEGYTYPNNLIFDFNFDIFITLTGKIENMHVYETAYRHYFMLIYVLDIMRSVGIDLSELEDDFFNILFPTLFNSINSTVLTGMEAFAEFDLDYQYVLLYDELQRLTPESNHKFSYTVTPENLSITYKIKEYSIVTKKFAKYLGNAPTDEDIGKVIKSAASPKGLYRIKNSDVIHLHAIKDLDTATFSELRIIQGSTTNSMRVLIRLSGQRIINRLFSINGNVRKNIKTHKLQEYIYMSDNIVAFVLWIFLHSTVESQNKFKNFEPSKLLPYLIFTQEYIKQKQAKIFHKSSKSVPRGVIPNTATIIMLSKLPVAVRESFINKNFKPTDTQQKALIKKCITKIEYIQEKNNIKKSYVTRLVKELERVYKW